MFGPKHVAAWLMRPFTRRIDDARSALSRPSGEAAARAPRRSGQGMGDVMARFTSTWRPRRTTLVSHLSPDGCRDVLRRNIDGPVPLFGGRAAYGAVGEDSARLTKRAGYFNAWQTVMSVTFEPRGAQPGAGTTLRCRSSAGLVAKLLTFAWLALGLAGIVVWAMVRSRPDLPADPRLLLGAGVMVLLAGVWLIAWLRWLSRDDHDWLLAFLANTISARRG